MQKYHVVSYRIRTFRTGTIRYDMILLHSLKSLLNYLVNKRLQLCIAKLLAVLFTRLFPVWIVPDVGTKVIIAQCSKRELYKQCCQLSLYIIDMCSN